MDVMEHCAIDGADAVTGEDSWQAFVVRWPQLVWRIWALSCRDYLAMARILRGRDHESRLDMSRGKMSLSLRGRHTPL